MPKKVAVSRHALIQRINRSLRKDDRMLKITRGQRAQLDLGDAYIINFIRNAVMQTNVDIEALGRELGALRDFEQMV